MFLSIIYGYFHISSNFLQRNNIMINLIQRRKNGNKPIHLRSILINNCKNNKNGANKKISMQKIMLYMYYNLTGHYFLQKEHIQKLYMNEQPVKLSLYPNLNLQSYPVCHQMVDRGCPLKEGGCQVMRRKAWPCTIVDEVFGTHSLHITDPFCRFDWKEQEWMNEFFEFCV